MNEKAVTITITPPNIQHAQFRIVGTAPYVQLRFTEKAMKNMAANMMEGSRSKKGKAREPRDFEDDFRQAPHISTEGWYGIPASAFRSGMISACRLVGFKMTLAKLSIFVQPDGFDKIDGTPLIKIEGEPEAMMMYVRNANTQPDLRVRAMWREWAATLRISYDGDQFSLKDVANLLMRVGQQVGIGEGRPDSKSSAGMGWGTFKLEE